MTNDPFKRFAAPLRRLLFTLSGLAVAALPSCGGDEVASAEAEVQERELFFEHVDKLGAPERLSPGLGTSAFNLCIDEVPREAADLNQAAWMSYFSTNEYAHIGYMGPVMKRLGFVNPAGGELDWRQCAVDLQAVRKTDSEFSGGPCADRWRAERTVHPDKAISPGDLFHAWLVRTPKAYNYVEFMAGESWSVEGTGDDGGSQTRRFEEGTTQVMIARHPARNAIVIAFRGTTDWQDVLADAEFEKVDLETDAMAKAGWGDDWGQMHGGFFKAYMSVDAQLAEIGSFLHMEGARPRIYLTGHSLGAALATVLASRILQANERRKKAGEPTYDLRGLYTYGSPRVGDDDFADQLEDLAEDYGVTLARFRNGDDTITNNPKIGFEHVGRMWHLGERTPGSKANDSTVRTYKKLNNEPTWALTPSDHASSGFGQRAGRDGGEAEWFTADTGYYRRLLELYRSQPFGVKDQGDDAYEEKLLSRCADPRK